MRCVIQKVTSASVEVAGEVVGQIENGFMVLVGAQDGDTESDARYCAEKIAGLRVFEDENEKMNLSVQNMGGKVLAVSQFTLLGDARGQNRPGFTQAEASERANELYEACCGEMRRLGVQVENGVFRTHMMVHLVNDGPVTILLDSKKLF